MQVCFNQSRAKHAVSPPWPCQGGEPGYFLAGLHIAGQGLTDPARPGDTLRPCDYPASPARSLGLTRRAECLFGGPNTTQRALGLVPGPLSSGRPSK